MEQTKPNNKSIIGFFHAIELPWNASEEDEAHYEQKRTEFSTYLANLKNKLGQLHYTDYGKDLELILFQFQLFPNNEAAGRLKGIENYRPKEKSIGINILIDDENFFNKPVEERYAFLCKALTSRMGELRKRLHQKNLDTDIDKLISDVEALIS